MRHHRLYLFLIFFLAAAIGFAKPPLHGVHWDSPIYLYQSKRLAETALLDSYRQHAKEISNLVYGAAPLPRGEAYSEAYWRFTRLGHIALLGLITNWFGSSETAIIAAHWIYTLLLAGSVLLAVMLAQNLHKLIRGETAPTLFVLGSTASALCYIGSGIYLHLTGNLVSEVPALFFLLLGSILLVKALQHNSAVLGLLSGVVAFITYTMKMEAIWSYIAFACSLCFAVYHWRIAHIKPILAAFSVAALFYFIYAWLFQPLADPRLFIRFTDSMPHAIREQPISAHQLIAVAGGALWFGVIAALARPARDPFMVLGWLWLLLALLPAAFFLFGHGAASQARMFALLMPGLLFMSTLGWERVMEIAAHRQSLRAAPFAALIIACFGAILISQPLFYERLRSLPGTWRLQYARNFLSPPLYETVSYKFSELALVSKEIYRKANHVLVIVDDQISQENLNLIRYFGPIYPRRADLAEAADPANFTACHAIHPQDYEPASFCQQGKTGIVATSVETFMLARSDRANSSHSLVLPESDMHLKTDHFVVYRVYQSGLGEKNLP